MLVKNLIPLSLCFALGSLAMVAKPYLTKNQFPEEIRQDFDAIPVHRKGDTEGSDMITHGFTQIISPDREYRFTEEGLEETGQGTDAIDGLHYIDIEGKWLNHGVLEEDEANVLGERGRLILDYESLLIPESKATKETLSYFGGKLLEYGDTVVIESPKKLPVSAMTVGKNYVKDYLLQGDLGGGAYIEYHDNPHFHMPMDEKAGGYLILGKKISKGKFRLTAFRIPFGKAVYTRSYAIHADSFLTGKYSVVYSSSEDYSTGVIKDQAGSLISVGIDSLE